MHPSRQQLSLVSSECSSTESDAPNRTHHGYSPRDTSLAAFGPNFDINAYNSNGQGAVSSNGDDNCEHIFKIILCGPEQSGKTTLLQRFITDIPPSETYSPTLSMSVRDRMMCLEDDQDRYRIRCQVWDLMGGRKYQRLSLSYFKSASAIIFCFRDQDAESLQQALSWVQTVKAKQLDTEVALLLVNCGVEAPPACNVHYNLTHRPSEDRSYTVHGAFDAHGLAVAKEHGLVYLECDAASGANVAQVFGVAVAEAFVLKYQQLYSERQQKRIQRALSRADIRRLFNTLAQRERARTGRAPTEDEQLALVKEAEAEARAKEAEAAETARIKEEEERAAEEAARLQREEEERRILEEKQELAEAEAARQREEEEQMALRAAEEAAQDAKGSCTDPFVNSRGERQRVTTRRIETTRQLVLPVPGHSHQQDDDDVIDSSIYDHESTLVQVLSAPANIIAYPLVKILDFVTRADGTSDEDIENGIPSNLSQADVCVVGSDSQMIVEKSISL